MHADLVARVTETSQDASGSLLILTFCNIHSKYSLQQFRFCALYTIKLLENEGEKLTTQRCSTYILK